MLGDLWELTFDLGYIPAITTEAEMMKQIKYICLSAAHGGAYCHTV